MLDIYKPYQTPTSLIQDATANYAPPVQPSLLSQVPRSLDQLFNAYMGGRQIGKERARQSGQDLMNYGVDPSQVTPQAIEQAKQPPTPNEDPHVAGIRAFMERRQREQDLKFRESESNIAKNMASANRPRLSDLEREDEKLYGMAVRNLASDPLFKYGAMDPDERAERIREEFSILKHSRNDVRQNGTTAPANVAVPAPVAQQPSGPKVGEHRTRKLKDGREVQVRYAGGGQWDIVR